MTQSGAGASAWIQLNSLGWAGEFLDKDSLGKVVESLNKTNPMFIDRPHLCFEQLYYYFFNVASSFKGLDDDVSYNALIAMWLCNNCRASLTKPKPHPTRNINEKEEYSKFFPHRPYLPRHFLADRVQRAKLYIENLPQGLSTSHLNPEADVERFIRCVEDDYPEGKLPFDLALPVETLKQAVRIQKEKNIKVLYASIVPATDPANPLQEQVLQDLAGTQGISITDYARAVEPVVHQPRGDERGAEHESARGQDQPL